MDNRYKIVKQLGKGGFGAVYLALDTRLTGVRVAVKENFETSPESQEQFRIEARVLSTLHHTSLPTVSDLIEVNGQQFLIMDFVEGQDLENIVKSRGRLTEAEVLPWLIQVCDALAYLHKQSPPVVHRDIKPPNIRIRSDNCAVLVDFGIAKFYRPTQKTIPGARAVSPGFSPLEQYGGGTTDPRSDIYALGATMYFVFTGIIPPPATERSNNPSLMRAPRQLNASLSPQMESLILRAMAIKPDQRFPSAAILQQALESILGNPVSGSAFPQAVSHPAFTPLPSSSSLGPAVACPHCGWINRQNARHCSSCGHSLVASIAVPSVQAAAFGASAALHTLACPSCGYMNRSTAKRCSDCGKPLPAALAAAPLSASQLTPPSTPFSTPLSTPLGSSRSSSLSAPLSTPIASGIAANPTPATIVGPSPSGSRVTVNAFGKAAFRYLLTIFILSVVLALIGRWLVGVGSLGAFLLVTLTSIAGPLAYLILRKFGAAFLAIAVQIIAYSILTYGSSFLYGFSPSTVFFWALGTEAIYLLGRYRFEGVWSALIAPLVGVIAASIWGIPSSDSSILIAAPLGGLVAFILWKISKR
ncbi:MAG: protein kinase [Anaerolineae bacterium]